MKRIVLSCLMVACLRAQGSAKITYLAAQVSVQDVVRTIAAQANFGYGWQKSYDQTNPLCRRWVRNVRIEGVSFEIAMRQILEPVGLRYEIENNSVVLYRGPDASEPNAPEPSGISYGIGKFINYSTDKKSVQYIVIDLARQVGLAYNWQKSFAQTDPECRRFVFNVSINNQPFENAMEKILNPVKLRYEVEDGEVVLYRR